MTDTQRITHVCNNCRQQLWTLERHDLVGKEFACPWCSNGRGQPYSLALIASINASLGEDAELIEEET